MENKSAQKKVSPYKEKTTVDPSQHQREAFQTHLQLTNVVWDHFDFFRMSQTIFLTTPVGLR